MQDVGGRGLAVGPRNAVDLHAPRRISIDLPGQHRQSTPGICYDRGRDTRNVALSHDENGPTTYGLGRELRSVTLEARDLRPENPGKLCPVQDHSPSLARANTRTSRRFSQKNTTRRNMREIPLNQQ